MNNSITLEKINTQTVSITKKENYNNNLFVEVENYSANEFEQFILEYLVFIKKEELELKNIYKVGGSSDKGIDVYAEDSYGHHYYYQCKHYISPLNLSEINRIVIKIFAYFIKKEIDYPDKIHIIGMNDISIKSAILIGKSHDFKKNLIDNIDKALKSEKISISEKENEKIKKTIESYDMDNIIIEKIREIVKEYYTSPIGNIRFFIDKEVPLKKFIPKENTKYLFEEQINNFLCIKKESKKLKKFILDDARQSYFCIESLKLTDMYYFRDNKEFELFINDIYNSEKFELEFGVKTIEAVKNVLKSAAKIETNKSFLDRKLHFIGSNERQGACHYIVQCNKGWWKKNE